jgi:hypothetical protein
VIVHILMVALVPRTFPTMFTGRARLTASTQPQMNADERR